MVSTSCADGDWRYSTTAEYSCFMHVSNKISSKNNGDTGQNDF
ncbi:hypothetical protein [Sediminicola sp. 1XM1-17]